MTAMGELITKMFAFRNTHGKSAVLIRRFVHGYSELTVLKCVYCGATFINHEQKGK